MCKTVVERSLVSLQFPDGTSWAIMGGDPTGRKLVQSLAEVMRLNPSTSPSPPLLLIKEDISQGTRRPELPLVLDLAQENHCRITCAVLPVNNITIDIPYQLRELAYILCSRAEARGGILIHGALAEINGRGVILAGPGGIGKSTASRRLPAPWHPLSDDCTLLVRKPDGLYFAHPWPTWSTCLDGNKMKSWDVQTGVPLQAVCMLNQGDDDAIKPLQAAKAVCMLNETAEQAWCGLSTEFDQDRIRILRTRRFTNICELSKSIPSYLLIVSKKGAFWEKIAEVLT